MNDTKPLTDQERSRLMEIREELLLNEKECKHCAGTGLAVREYGPGTEYMFGYAPGENTADCDMCYGIGYVEVNEDEVIEEVLDILGDQKDELIGEVYKIIGRVLEL